MNADSTTEWQKLSDEEKKCKLFLRQKKLLDDFLKRGAISKQQFDKSYGDMKAKMGFDDAAAKRI